MIDDGGEEVKHRCKTFLVDSLGAHVVGRQYGNVDKHLFQVGLVLAEVDELLPHKLKLRRFGREEMYPHNECSISQIIVEGAEPTLVPRLIHTLLFRFLEEVERNEVTTGRGHVHIDHGVDGWDGEEVWGSGKGGDTRGKGEIPGENGTDSPRGSRDSQRWTKGGHR